MAFNFLPLAPLNFSIVKSNKFTNGCGPLALPPNVFNRCPAGRILFTFILGILFVYRYDIKSLNALAHPSLESATEMTSSVCSNSLSGMVGSLSTYCLSTEKPTPVPFINMYSTSSKERGLSIGMYEQLYPAMFSLRNASPAVIKALIDGMTDVVSIASSILSHVLFSNFTPMFLST